jgi:hypothetical protein
MAETTPVPEVRSGSHGPRHRDSSGGLVVGVVLILLGVAFLAQSVGYLTLTGNWWAIFIYILAIAALWNAWRAYRVTGYFGAQASGSLTWGLVFAVVATIFILDLPWDVWWPVLVITFGIGIVLGSLLGGRRGSSGPGTTI